MKQLRTLFSMSGCLLASASLVLLGGKLAGAASVGHTYEGAPVQLGNGTARAVVRTDASGKPISVAAQFTPRALEGLPTVLNKNMQEGQWEYFLPMPADGLNTGYRGIVIDWNLHGHPPPHVYSVPHFDFHFYTIDRDTVQNISFSGPTDAATQVSDAAIVPPDYKVIPATAVNQMGVHAPDLTAPEFHGKPFTATFIYGYYKGELIFVEPMVTRAYLLTKPDVTLPVKVPARYSHAAYYPTSYSVRYDTGRHAYAVELNGLRPWQETEIAKAAPKK